MVPRIQGKFILRVTMIVSLCLMGFIFHILNKEKLPLNKMYLPLNPESTARPAPEGGKHCDVHDFRSHVNTTDEHEFECVRTTTSPNIRVCLYPNNVDIYVSTSIRAIGRWENEITQGINNLMSMYPKATFIDIGANVGIHGLVVARTGRDVIAIEPKWSSIQRIHKSVNLNQFTDNYILVRNAISNTRGKLSLYSDGTNQGGSSIRFALPYKESIYSIVMDDLLDVFQGTEAIMKMDIQGAEYKALLNSTAFFEEIIVHAIFMEWEEMGHYIRTKEGTDRAGVLQMVAYLRSMGFVALPVDNKANLKTKYKPLKDTDMKIWPVNIVWLKDRPLKSPYKPG